MPRSPRPPAPWANLTGAPGIWPRRPYAATRRWQANSSAPSQREQARAGWAAASQPAGPGRRAERRTAGTCSPPARRGTRPAAWPGAPGRAQALFDEAAAYRADRGHIGLAQQVQARDKRLLHDRQRDSGCWPRRWSWTPSRYAAGARRPGRGRRPGPGRGRSRRPGPPGRCGAGGLYMPCRRLRATASDALLDTDAVPAARGCQRRRAHAAARDGAIREQGQEAPERSSRSLATTCETRRSWPTTSLYAASWRGRLDARSTAASQRSRSRWRSASTRLSKLLAASFLSRRCSTKRSTLDKTSGYEEDMSTLLHGRLAGRSEPGPRPDRLHRFESRPLHPVFSAGRTRQAGALRPGIGPGPAMQTYASLGGQIGYTLS